MIRVSTMTDEDKDSNSDKERGEKRGILGTDRAKKLGIVDSDDEEDENDDAEA